MDMEKVIEGLETIRYNLRQMNHGLLADFCDDALELLKEQEAVEPKVEKAILDYQSWHYICGDCGGQIDIQDNYCRHCGRVVAHISNKI